MEQIPESSRTINPVTMTDFSTHFSKSKPLERMIYPLIAAILICLGQVAMAQSTTEISQVRVERIDDELLVSAQIGFELPTAVEDALLKAIPMYFVLQAEIAKERWYWYDKKVVSTDRYIRVAYQPLTRRWRLNVSAGADRSGSSGLVLNQSFDTLQQAMAVVKRVFRWKIADAGEVDSNGKYKLDLLFRLDLSQLPRPFQIGAIGQSDWDVSASVVTPLVVDVVK